ncbi:PAS domain-containing protein [Rhizobium bangladeshense]|uniref:PAS domain-containing protein n=1 Tax=Rhizobium bangladeshense TaxID=1138189 RepID=UPI0007E53AAE|nr:PAS domain-containing protein [Rhizobium bangladeshense]
MPISLEEERFLTGPSAASILERLPGLVWTTDGAGAVTYANHRLAKYTGLEWTAGVPGQWLTVFHPDDASVIVEKLEDAQCNSLHVAIEGRLRRWDGEYRWFALSASPLDDSHEGAYCWLAVGSDETPADHEFPVLTCRMQRFLDALPMQALLVSPTVELEFANQEVWRWHGFSQEPSLRQQLSNFDSDELNRILGPLKANLQKGALDAASHRAVRADGAVRWLETRMVPIRDAAGNVARYCVLQSDVQDFRHATYLLANEVEILEMVGRGVPTPHVLQKLCHLVEDLSADCFCCFLELSLDRKFFRVGAAPGLPNEFKEIFDGKAIEMGLGPCASAAISRRTVEVFDCASDELRETPIGKLMLVNGLKACTAIPILSPYGNTAGIFAIFRHRHKVFAPHERQVIERAAHIAGISIDRTRHEEALVKRETQFERSQAQLVAAQRISSTGSFTSDISQDENIWSEEFYRIFDLDPNTDPSIDAVRGRIHPDDLELFNVEMERGLAGEGADFVFRIVTSDGSVRFIRGLARLTHYIGDRPVFMGTVQDITEAKRAEDALRRGEEALSKAREELAYVSRAMTISALTTSIAHEVSQPLSGILANANACVRLLAMDPPNITAAAETARRTIRDTMRATEVIKRLRAMFNRQSPTMEEIDLNEITREVIALSSRDMQQKLIALNLKLEPHVLRVIGDRIQLQQVILNMVLNATEAMADIEGRPRSMVIHTYLDPCGSPTLSITDTGVGISTENANKLFEAFFTTKQHGMGIGLSISRSIIANHGGVMWAKSNDGPGATVAFSIPRQDRS